MLNWESVLGRTLKAIFFKGQAFVQNKWIVNENVNIMMWTSVQGVKYDKGTSILRFYWEYTKFSQRSNSCLSPILSKVKRTSTRTRARLFGCGLNYFDSRVLQNMSKQSNFSKNYSDEKLGASTIERHNFTQTTNKPSNICFWVITQYDVLYNIWLNSADYLK